MHRVLTHKHIQVAVAAEPEHRVIVLPMRAYEIVGLDLAFREKAQVLVAGKERKPGICLRRPSREIRRQSTETFHRDEMSRTNASGYLLEKGYGNCVELTLDPFVSLIVQVLMAPERWESTSIREAHLFAHGIVALVVRERDESGNQLRGNGGRVDAPMWIEIIGD